MTAKRVLVVEDDRVINQALGDRLRAEGYDVSAAFDGPSAVEAHRRNPADVVVLDPPRAGAGAAVVSAVAAAGRARAVAYVACDGGSLARDAAMLGQHGWELSGLRAFDLFGMSHHVEAVATFRRS